MHLKYPVETLNCMQQAILMARIWLKQLSHYLLLQKCADDGNNYMRLANVYLNLDKYEEAASAIDKALNKGGLSRPDQSSLMQGQAYLSLEQFDKARASFREAAKTAKDDRTEKMSRDLLRYVDSEEKKN